MAYPQLPEAWEQGGGDAQNVSRGYRWVVGGGRS